MFSSVANPVLYSLLNESFRVAVRYFFFFSESSGKHSRNHLRSRDLIRRCGCSCAFVRAVGHVYSVKKKRSSLRRMQGGSGDAGAAGGTRMSFLRRNRGEDDDGHTLQVIESTSCWTIKSLYVQYDNLKISFAREQYKGERK